MDDDGAMSKQQRINIYTTVSPETKKELDRLSDESGVSAGRIAGDLIIEGINQLKAGDLRLSEISVVKNRTLYKSK